MFPTRPGIPDTQEDLTNSILTQGRCLRVVFWYLMLTCCLFKTNVSVREWSQGSGCCIDVCVAMAINYCSPTNTLIFSSFPCSKFFALYLLLVYTTMSIYSIYSIRLHGHCCPSFVSKITTVQNQIFNYHRSRFSKRKLQFTRSFQIV